MWLVIRALGNPAFQRFFLGGRELLFRRGWRHRFVRITGGDSLNDSAFCRLFRHNSSVLNGNLALVESQVGLARCRVGPMTGKAVFREDRPDIAVVLEVVS